MSTIASILPLLNDAKQGKLLFAPELATIAGCINNSLVGTSKFLHCINPSLYPIWDSHIYRYWTSKKSLTGVNNPKLYCEYQNDLFGLMHHPDYDTIHRQIEDWCRYQLTPMRAIELVLFETEKRKKK